MKAQISIIATILFLSLLTSCRDQKTTEKEVEAEVKIEQIEEQPVVEIAEKRRQDSIRQVKEHGHAH